MRGEGSGKKRLLCDPLVTFLDSRDHPGRRCRRAERPWPSASAAPRRKSMRGAAAPRTEAAPSTSHADERAARPDPTHRSGDLRKAAQ